MFNFSSPRNRKPIMFYWDSGFDAKHKKKKKNEKREAEFVAVC